MTEPNLLEYLISHYPDRDDIQIQSLQNVTTGWETKITMPEINQFILKLLD